MTKINQQNSYQTEIIIIIIIIIIIYYVAGARGIFTDHAMSKFGDSLVNWYSDKFAS